MEEQKEKGLFLVGLGLGDEKDVTLRGYETICSCEDIYLETYTSILGVGKDRLEAFYKKTIIEADRELVEQKADMILDSAERCRTAFLVVGDPLGFVSVWIGGIVLFLCGLECRLDLTNSATTHTDLLLRAKQRSIPVEVIHNASIMNAAGVSGLQLYSFGQTVSIVFWDDNWRPDSFYSKIKQNADLGFHTLCLLDIKVKEQSVENLCRNRKIYEPPRYMSVNQCIKQLLECEEKNALGICTPQSKCIGLARVGQPTQCVRAGTMSELVRANFGPPLHSFILCGQMHPLEEEYFDYYRKETSESNSCILDEEELNS